MRLKMTVYPNFHGEVSFRAIDMAKNQKASEYEAIVVDEIDPVLNVVMPEAAPKRKALFYDSESVGAADHDGGELLRGGSRLPGQRQRSRWIGAETQTAMSILRNIWKKLREEGHIS